MKTKLLRVQIVADIEVPENTDENELEKDLEIVRVIEYEKSKRLIFHGPLFTVENYVNIVCWNPEVK